MVLKVLSCISLRVLGFAVWFSCVIAVNPLGPASLWVSLGSIADPSQVPRDSWRCLDVNIGWQAEGVNCQAKKDGWYKKRVQHSVSWIPFVSLWKTFPSRLLVECLRIDMCIIVNSVDNLDARTGASPPFHAIIKWFLYLRSPIFADLKLETVLLWPLNQAVKLTENMADRSVVANTILFVKKIFWRSRGILIFGRRWSVAECCGFERTEVRSLRLISWFI